MTSKIQVGDIVRVTIEGEVGYVSLDGKGFDFSPAFDGRTPNSVRLNTDGVSVEVIKAANSAEKQFEALRVGAAFRIFSPFSNYIGDEGLRIKTSDNTYFNVDQRIEYTIGKGNGSTLSNTQGARIEEVTL